jgi:methylmalonyl-CoA mutase cobalamin-binding subunit
VLAEGRALAKDWKVVPGPFLKERGVASEAEHKRRTAAEGRIMQHAQIGFRELAKSRRAYREIYETCAAKGVTVDRYGICLDWSMALPRALREKGVTGTGMILKGIEDFVAFTSEAPVAPHFGDFVMGFPAALENTQAALAAGASSIGNLGQYFTFAVPGHSDDIATTRATVLALGLIAAQDVEVLVHSNLDDGFAALFTDLASSLGAILIEKHIIEELVGAHVSHCYGNHFTDPLRRLAFQLALSEVTDTPGTMVYGNTVSYRGNAAQNFASSASYLLADITGQRVKPSGHAINPVPVTENTRIPDIDEVIDAQLFAARLVEDSQSFGTLIDTERAQAIADEVVAGGRRFRDSVMRGLAEEEGVDTRDAFQMLLALRRLGGKVLEERWGAGSPDKSVMRGRRPVVAASLIDEINGKSREHLKVVPGADRMKLAGAGLKVLVATTDVHEHGKLLLENVFRELDVEPIDGGVSVEPDRLAARAAETAADAIALSTYNGVALKYLKALKSELKRAGLETPVLIGGRLNQVPEGSNTSLPVDVTSELKAEGAIVCEEVEGAVPALLSIAAHRTKGKAPVPRRS